MKALNILKRFAKDEDGAVTVDWVVLTAAIVGLGLIVITAVRPGVENLAGNIGAELNDWEVGVGPGTGTGGGTGGGDAGGDD